MARFSDTKRTFSRGEVSPLVWQRHDMQFHGSALARCENFVPDQFGSLHRRPGTEYRGSLPEKPCLYPFRASQDEPLLIAALPGEFRFYRDGVAVSPDGVSEGLATPYTGGDQCELKFAGVCGAMFVVHPNHAPRLLRRTETEILFENLGSSPYDELNGDPDCKLTLGAGGSATDAPATVKGVPVNVGDVLKLSNDAGLTFYDITIAAVGGPDTGIFTLPAGMPTGEFEVYEANLAPPPDFVATGETVVVSSDAASLTANGCAPFTPEMVGLRIRVLDEAGAGDNDPNTWVSVVVTQYISPTEVVVAYGGPEIEETRFFALPLFAEGVFPQAVWVHQDRLWFGIGNRLVGSAAGDFDDWEPTDPDGTVNPDNAIYTRINSGECAQIQWMRTMGRQLVIGTSDDVQAVFGAGVGGTFAADGVGQQQVEHIAMSDIRPVEVGSRLVAVDRPRRRVFSAGFGGQYDQIVLNDETILADHIGVERFSKTSFQEHPFPIIWAVTDAHRLVSMTYWPEQQVSGWARHRLGGKGPCGAPEVHDVETVPTVDGENSLTYLVVRRTLGGVGRWCIETLAGFFEHNTVEEDAAFLDCSVSNPVQGFPTEVTAVNGPELTVSVSPPADQPAALQYRDQWYYGEFVGGLFRLASPNTTTITRGETLFDTGDGWSLAERGVWVPPDACLLDVPCGEVFARTTSQVEFPDLGADEVSVYCDANDAGRSAAPFPEALFQRVGFPYLSEIEFLPIQVGLGVTDGSNDPTRVVEVAAYVYRTPMLYAGTPGQVDAYRIAEAMVPFEMPEDFGTHNPTFFSGWVAATPEGVSIQNNNDRSVIVRAQGPWPATIRAIEFTTVVSGGR